MKSDRHVRMNLKSVNGGYCKDDIGEFTFEPCLPTRLETFFQTFDIQHKSAENAFTFAILKDGFFDIKDVIFHDPATIVFWGDSTKTVVKALDEPYDPEKGLAMAIAKHFFGNKWDYYNQFLHWLKKYKTEENSFDFSSVAESFRSLSKAINDFGKDG